MEVSVLRRLAAFFLLTALMAVGLQLLITWSLKRITDGELGAFNRAMQGRVNAEVVVSGSSRAFRHYDPRILGQETGLTFFNLGRNGSQIDVQLGVLKAYLSHNRKPKFVIQNLDLQSFILTRSKDIFDPAEYVPYLRDPEIYHCLRQINPDVWKWKYFPLYAYATEDTSFTWTKGFLYIAGLARGEPCFDGFCPVDRGWTNDFARFKRDHSDGVKIAIDPAGVATLEALIKLCQERGIKVVLVYSPQYYEMVGLTRNRKEIFSTIAAIAGRHGVDLLDYTESQLSKSRGLFYNAQHLNERGAAEFSADLAQRLITMGVALHKEDFRAPVSVLTMPAR